MRQRGLEFVRRSKHVLGIGDGPLAKKAVDLALKHPKDNFAAVDRLLRVKYGKYLLFKNVGKKPVNLNVKEGTLASHQVANCAPHSLDHAYAHFALQHMPYAERQKVYGELFRALKSGATLTIVEEANHMHQFAQELGKNGFKVRTKRITSQETRSLDTPHGEANAVTAIRLQERVAQLTPSDRKEWLERVKEKLREKKLAIEGPNPSPQARKYIEFVARDMGEMLSQKPFAVITARKPREKI